ncbi:MAG: DUF423 domain-containing protein [Opitutae bacterium]|nr:DUF423 domain-containing protein [Opitutae bacterium]
MRRFIKFSGILGFSGVFLGAFGAHGLKTFLQRVDRVETWETATFYLLVHSVALLVIGFRSHPRASDVLIELAGWFWLSGSVLFSGTLYLLCLSGISWLGAVTPLGGILFLAGWGSLCLAGLNVSKASLARTKER